MKVFSGRQIAYFAGLLFAAAFLAGIVRAEEPKPLPENLLALPVDRLVRLALDNNLGIKIAETQVQLAQLELVRQRAEVAMKVTEAAARWRRTQGTFKTSGTTIEESEAAAANFARDEAERELRSLIGVGKEKGGAASAAPTETHKASLEIRIGRYGELSWEVKGLPIPQELCRGEGNLECAPVLFAAMWWLNGSRVTASLNAPVDVSPDFVSGVVSFLKPMGIDSVNCMPTAEHMALPTIEQNLRNMGEALQQAFKEKMTGKVGPSELEAFLKEFQIPTANLKPTDREMTYRLELFVPKNLLGESAIPRIGAFASLPGDAHTGNLAVISLNNGVPRFSDQSYAQLMNSKNWSDRVETVFSKSVKVPAAQPASGR